LTSSYGGTDRSNYTITDQPTANANITKKDVLIVSLTADDKFYNASAVANISAGTVAGTVGSETLLISGSGTFDSINTGTGKIVSSNNANLTKIDGTGSWNNYNLTNSAPLKTTASIVPVIYSCVEANGCITTEPSTLAKISMGPSIPSLMSTVGTSQLVKSTASTPQFTVTPASTPPVSLIQPISSSTIAPKSLSPAQVAELASSQVGPLIKSLDRNQLLAITEKQMRGMNVNQLNELILLLDRIANPAKR